MINFKRNRGWRHIFQSKPVLALLGGLILLFAWSIVSFWGKMEETSKNKKILEDRIATLKQQADKLTSDINTLETDQGKEKIFRENFGLVKEGEDVIVIVEDKNAAADTPPPGGFFSFFKNWFK